MNKHVFTVSKKDLDITYFSGTGAGGQHRNRHCNCVRIKHRATGIIKTGQSSRSRKENESEAFKSLCKDRQFLAYCLMGLVELETGMSTEEIVDEEMKNIKIEVKHKGKFIPWDEWVEKYAELEE